MLEAHDHATLTLSRSAPVYSIQDLRQQCAIVCASLLVPRRSTRDLRAVAACLRAHDLCTLLQELDPRLELAEESTGVASRAALLTLTHAYESLLQLQQHLHELWVRGREPDPRWFAAWREPRLALETLEMHLRVAKERLARVTVLLALLLPSSHSTEPITRPEHVSQPIDIPAALPFREAVGPPTELTAYSVSPNFVYTEILLEEVDGGIVTDYWDQKYKIERAAGEVSVSRSTCHAPGCP